MDLAQEILSLLEKARATDEYFNPHFLSDVTSSLYEVYGISDPFIDEWVNKMWSR